jgi:hypothetical protein
VGKKGDCLWQKKMYNAGNEYIKHEGKQGSCIATRAGEVKQCGHQKEDRFSAYLSWIIITKSKGKGRAIPLNAWTGPEGSRRLRIQDFKTIGT